MARVDESVQEQHKSYYGATTWKRKWHAVCRITVWVRGQPWCTMSSTLRREHSLPQRHDTRKSRKSCSQLSLRVIYLMCILWPSHRERGKRPQTSRDQYTQSSRRRSETPATDAHFRNTTSNRWLGRSRVRYIRSQMYNTSDNLERWKRLNSQRVPSCEHSNMLHVIITLRGWC